VPGVLGIDSRPLGTSPDGTREPKAPAPAPGGPLAGMIPRGFAGRVTMTITAPTLLGLAGRPGEMDGIGPIDPDPEANTPDRYRAVAWHWSVQDRHRSVRPVHSSDKAKRVPVRQHFGPRRQDRERGAVGSCWNAFIWLRNESCKQTW
jgi:hypothetical protein